MKKMKVAVIGSGNDKDAILSAVKERGIDITVVDSVLQEDNKELKERMESELKLRNKNLPSFEIEERYLKYSNYPSGREKRRERRRLQRKSK
jgi:UDP-N-acetylmuramoylalanine-D-glutamate ligase